MTKGDATAWAAVYDQLADRVFQHALYRLGGDREAAEAITQEVFVRAIESIDAYEPQKGTFLGWLRGICRRAIARQYRTSRSRWIQAVPVSSSPDASGCFPEPVDPALRPDEQLILADEQLLTGAALTSLPYRWEQVLRLKYCHDLSVAEIGAQLGTSDKAVESMLSRARAAFRQVYARMAQAGPTRLHEVEGCDE